MSDTINLVRLRLKQDRAAAEWLKVNEKINEWAKKQPGFRFRSLSEADNGEWTIISYWESLGAANAAEQRFGAEMMAMCEPLISSDSVSMSQSKAHLMQQG